MRVGRSEYHRALYYSGTFVLLLQRASLPKSVVLSSVKMFADDAIIYDDTTKSDQLQEGFR